MNLQMAFYSVVHDFRGGVAAVALLLGMSPNTLQNKANPNDSTHHPMLEEAARVSEVTADMRILHAFAARLHHMAVPLPAVEGDAGEAVQRMARVATEFGEYFTQVSTALGDGKVSPNELKRCETELGELIAAAQSLGAMLQRLSETGGA